MENTILEKFLKVTDTRIGYIGTGIAFLTKYIFGKISIDQISANKLYGEYADYIAGTGGRIEAKQVVHTVLCPGRSRNIMFHLKKHFKTGMKTSMDCILFFSLK